MHKLHRFEGGNRWTDLADGEGVQVADFAGQRHPHNYYVTVRMHTRFFA